MRWNPGRCAARRLQTSSTPSQQPTAERRCAQVGFLDSGTVLYGLESRMDGQGRERVRFDKGWVTVRSPTKIFATQVPSRCARVPAAACTHELWG